MPDWVFIVLALVAVPAISANSLAYWITRPNLLADRPHVAAPTGCAQNAAQSSMTFRRFSNKSPQSIGRLWLASSI
jgi:hypothetical protein